MICGGKFSGYIREYAVHFPHWPVNPVSYKTALHFFEYIYRINTL